MNNHCKPGSTFIGQDVVTDNEFEKRLLSEVIPPSDIGVTFEDIGALENVKETLKNWLCCHCKGQSSFVKAN